MKKILLFAGFLAFLQTAQGQLFSNVSTFLGGFPGYEDGDTSTARVKEPFGIWVDPNNGDLYICDHQNSVIRLVSTDGTVSTFAGNGSKAWKDGYKDTASFNQPTGITGDGQGNFYVADFLNQVIRKIDAAGFVTTVAGKPGIAGYQDGQDTAALFNYPRGLDLDAQGNLYLGDSWNHRIRKIDPSGNVTTYAGGGSSIGVQSPGDYVDGPDTSARFWTPTEVKVDPQGNVFVSDPYTHRIRKIDTARVVSTVAGSGQAGQTTGGFQDGHVTTARFNTPTTLFVDELGQIFVGDGPNQRVRMIGLDDTVRTVAGSGLPGFVNGAPGTAQFRFPRGIEKSADGRRLFVVDFNNHAIRSLWFAPPTGINEPAGQGILYYPNPVQEKLWIQANREVDFIRILNLEGMILHQTTTQGQNQIELNLGAISPGIYLLEMKGKKGIWREKLVKL
ncbi:MAG: T9SS type A sorting domain-containing protein [Bacteroidia bacterium]|nr:T9SS type A sorting domain-containing protein [Bacteroidia bacterium]